MRPRADFATIGAASEPGQVTGRNEANGRAFTAKQQADVRSMTARKALVDQRVRANHRAAMRARIRRARTGSTADRRFAEFLQSLLDQNASGELSNDALDDLMRDPPAMVAAYAKFREANAAEPPGPKSKPLPSESTDDADDRGFGPFAGFFCLTPVGSASGAQVYGGAHGGDATFVDVDLPDVVAPPQITSDSGAPCPQPPCGCDLECAPGTCVCTPKPVEPAPVDPPTPSTGGGPAGGMAPTGGPWAPRTYATPRATTPTKRPPPPDPEPVPTPPPPRPPVHPFDAERARVVAEADARARRSAAQDADDTARANAEAKQFFDAALEVALDIATSAVEASIAEYLNELLGTSAGDKASSDLSHRESAFARWKLEGALLGLRSKEAEKAALGSVLDALSQIVEKFVGRMRGAVAAPSGSAEDVADFWRRSAYVNKLTGALIRQKQKVMARLAVVEAWTAAPEDIDAFHLWSRAAEVRRTRNDRGDWYAARSAITVLGLGFRDLALGAIHASTFGVFDLKPALPDSSAFTAGAILGTPILGVAQAKVLGFLAREVATAARISASVSSRVVGPAMKAFAESVRKATATLGGRLGSSGRIAAAEGDAPSLWVYTRKPVGDTLTGGAAGRAWATAHGPGSGWATESGLGNALTRAWRTGSVRKYDFVREIPEVAAAEMTRVKGIGLIRGWKHLGKQYFTKTPGDLSLLTGQIARPTLGQSARYYGEFDRRPRPGRGPMGGRRVDCV